MESKKAQIREEYEEKLKIAIEEKEQAQQELVSIESKVEEALQKVDDLYHKVNHERKQKEELSTLASKLQELNDVLKEEHAKQKVMLDSVVDECNSS